MDYLPDDMIRVICNHMSISDLNNFVGANLRAYKLCQEILIGKRRRVALEVLTAEGIDVSASDLQKNALFQATNFNRKHIVKALLYFGVPPDTTLSTGMTALHIAARNNYTELVSILLRAGANPNTANSSGATPLHEAIMNGGAVSSVQLLLAAGANPNATDRGHSTPLHIVAFMGDSTLTRILLDAGANPNAQNIIGFTPLSIAIRNGSQAVVAMMQSVS